jgi:hypothetical protein
MDDNPRDFPRELLAEMALFFERDDGLRWTHGAMARDKGNMAVDVLADNAFSFSANGFLERIHAEGTISPKVQEQAYDLLIGAVFEKFAHRDLSRVNDHEGRQAIIDCARKAARVVETAPDPVLG